MARACLGTRGALFRAVCNILSRRAFVWCNDFYFPAEIMRTEDIQSKFTWVFNYECPLGNLVHGIRTLMIRHPIKLLDLTRSNNCSCCSTESTGKVQSLLHIRHLDKYNVTFWKESVPTTWPTPMGMMHNERFWQRFIFVGNEECFQNTFLAEIHSCPQPKTSDTFSPQQSTAKWQHFPEDTAVILFTWGLSLERNVCGEISWLGFTVKETQCLAVTSLPVRASISCSVHSRRLQVFLTTLMQIRSLLQAWRERAVRTQGTFRCGSWQYRPALPPVPPADWDWQQGGPDRGRNHKQGLCYFRTKDCKPKLLHNPSQ